ncbi:deoxynucleoside kinase [Marivirga tractuosa]|uniref:Deoxynucleoside kinase n=1 Tax=Marivirga tractuosa (strain ATCC 23168 / DSM 4126 / NBRC 15989 / NCIMB 1408 / VKM B-1430 / H-43) TaxID=643867 RepID=E4TRR1_MARTH|nr:deoxynucleoside kinase [Marivirga tractuosa]ADR22760.1 deoxynucleoside kinase [Marivirga tractuosa DSM 4126]BDD16569.1 deoxynucleoside kinase [Marivirga tractuosa]
MDQLKHIAIAGNIGAGKTTLANKLSHHYGWKTEFEAVEDNPYLVDFYKDMKQWAFHLQVYFLNSRLQQVKRIRESEHTVVQDRSIYEDCYVFAKNLHESGNMSDRDYHNYLELFDSMAAVITPPDLLIYLRADIPKLVGQIEKRGRDYEETIRIDYLKNLNKHYEAWVKQYDIGKLIIIDVNQLDYLNNVEDFALIVSKIDTEVHGLFSSQ